MEGACPLSLLLSPPFPLRLLTRRARVRLPQSGEPVPFLLLARTFEACSATTKRLEKDVMLTNALRSIIATTPDDLLPAVYLASCAIAPAYQNMKLGVGEQTVVKALAEATGRGEASVKELHDKEGDLGVVAQQCRSTQRIMFQPAPLTIRGVLAALRDIARTEGDQANEKKRTGIKRLLVAAREVEAGYLVRLLLGDLRVGLQLQTVIASVAHAALLQEDAAAAGEDAPAALRDSPLADRLSAADTLLKQVHSECPSWDLILPALLRDGVMQLPHTCHFVPGVPIKPMLAKATRGAFHRVLLALPRPALTTPRPQAWTRSLSALATWSSRASTNTTASARRSMCWTMGRCVCSAATLRTTRSASRTLWPASRSTSSRACAASSWTRRRWRSTGTRARSCRSRC